MSESPDRTKPFADRLTAAVAKHGPLCVGIDPHFGRIPRLFGPEGPGSIALWGQAIVALCADKVAMVKPQAGLFERWGAAGVAALESVCNAAHHAGLLVMLDAKRGDIGSTAIGYAEAYLGETASALCDAITVNPYMGLDTLEPFVDVAEANNKGVAVLARTSNPGSADYQAKTIDDEPLFMHVARSLNPLAQRLKGETTHWSGLMLVAGATGPNEARALRDAAPDCPFLVPGYGAQGAGAREAVAGFVSGPTGLEGGVVNASRSVTFPKPADDADTIQDWELAISTAIKHAQDDLIAATRAN